MMTSTAWAGDSVAEKFPADYVNPLIDTHKSRWFFFSSACRPFGLVNLSPDTKVGDDWMNGYIYGETNIQCFSHVHCWQLYGVPVMPQTGELFSVNGLAAAASSFSHQDEVVHTGYHRVFLQRYGIKAELTSTTRVGFHRYTFPASDKSFIAFDTGATLMAGMDTSSIRQISATEIAGCSVMSATMRRPKPFTIYFVAEFSRPVKFGVWKNKAVISGATEISGTNAGGYVQFATKRDEKVLMKVAISYTSEENAKKNLQAELPGWDFDRAVRESRAEWNVQLGRIPGKGMHKDGAAMTLEYAYEDWCLSQMALALGKTNDASWLNQRSFNYTNLWDASAKWMHPRHLDGTWLNPFSPVGKPGEFAAQGFCEASAAIYTHFVPQDIRGLIALFGGKDKYVSALNRQFELAAAARFVAPHGQHAAAWVDYDNEPSTAMAHLFNFAGAPWLTQKWVRDVQSTAFGDITPAGGYNGDEDQGQLGAVSALMAIGLFDVEGGAAVNPTYQITSPLFDEISIKLNQKYFSGKRFTIVTKHNSATNCYIQSVKLNDQPLNQFWFPHTALAKGGKLEINLGPQPSRWASESRLP